MIDQFNKPVPDDLVVLDARPDDLNAEDVRIIDNAVWYRPSSEEHGYRRARYLLVSQNELPEGVYGETYEEHTGETLRGVDWIAPVLHRYDNEQFYHA